MRPAIDISQLQYGFSGITNYIRGMIRIMKTFSNPILIKNYKGPSEFQGTRTFRFPFRGFKYRMFWDKHVIGRVASFMGADILITPYFNIPNSPKALKKVPVIYDLGFFHLNEKDIKAAAYFKEAVKRSVKGSHTIITISNSVKNEILQYFPDYNGSVIVLYPLVDVPEKPPEFKHRNGNVLVLGTVEKRKNPEICIEFFKRFKKHSPSSKLIFAGMVRKEFKSTLIDILEKLDTQSKNDIIFSGYVSQEEKSKLLRESSILLYPSEYEGFGIPVLEGIFAGLIPITLDTPVAKEASFSSGFVIDNSGILLNFDLASLSDSRVLAERAKDNYKIVSHAYKNILIEQEAELKRSITNL